MRETASNSFGHVCGYAPVQGALLHYEIQGSGHPLVWIHAGMVNNRMWDRQFDIFSHKYQVIRYDARGHGRSKSPPGRYSDFDDLHDLLEFLKIARAALVGLSLGASTAINFSLKYPSMVDALVLASPGLDDYPFTTEFLQQNTIQSRRAAKAHDLEEMIEAFQRSWTDGPYRRPDQVDPQVRELVRAMVLEGPQPQEKLGQNQPLNPSPINRLSDISAPTLCLVGNLDMPEILEIADLIVKENQLAEKLIMDGAAHMLNMEQPDRFNRIVFDFLNRSILY